LVTSFTNVTYLTGFTGDDSYLLVRPDGELMLSDTRYTVQLGEECPDIDVSIRDSKVTMLEAVVKALRAAKIRRLGIEADSMTVSLRDQLGDKLPKVAMISTSGLVEELRQVKDADEVARIRRAIRLAEKAFGVLRATLRPEKTEIEAAIDLEHQMRLFGAKYRGFQSIVGVGPRAALPHAVPTKRRIEESDFVLVDWGANEGLYLSDLTRVLVTGRISPKLRRIYGIVLKAQRRAIAAIRPGVSAKSVDRIARGVIADAGYGRYFGHGLGHGVGLEIHEAPRLAATSKAVLKRGMVITIEPGIYLPGWGGVRIEDDVLVTGRGHEVLSNASRELEDAVIR
jgi:Xaa-Pro aminopeptidase